METWIVGGRNELLTKRSPTSLFVVEKHKKVENFTRWRAEPAWQVMPIFRFSPGDYLPPSRITCLQSCSVNSCQEALHSLAFPGTAEHLLVAASLRGVSICILLAHTQLPTTHIHHSSNWNISPSTTPQNSNYLLQHKDCVITVFDEEQYQRGSSSWKDQEEPLWDENLQYKRADPLKHW